MFKTLSTFGLVLLYVITAVLVALSFLLGLDHPLPWIMLLVLVSIPLLEDRYQAKKFLTWDDSYSVGVDVLDKDHKKLLSLINQLQTASNYYTGHDFEKEALQAVVDYTVYHFQREEKLMQENDYPDFDAHKQKHILMIEKVNELSENYKKSPESTIDETLKFLKTWLIEHIKGTDMEYRSFFNAKGIK